MPDRKPPEPRRWSPLVLPPLALPGPPGLAVCLVVSLPYPPGERGGSTGLTVFPYVSAALLIFAAVKAYPGIGRWALLLLGAATTVVSWLFFTVGMMAP